ncbi:MAG: hypothetical protein JW873_00785 [Candidatus Saganbacteria bacterium]|nr:hypothetical protein [Candidatus Saganbacteria bacterium]
MVSCLLAGCLAGVAAGEVEELLPSHNMKLTTRVVDSGAAQGVTASFRLLGKTRGHGLAAVSAPSFSLGEGFLRTAYFGETVLAPLVTAIAPSTSEANKVVPVTVTGANFVYGATLKLSRSGEHDITAGNVTVVSSGQLTGEFDLTGARPGYWTVTVTNPDGRSGSLPDAFRVLGPAPVVTAVAPPRGLNNQILDVTIAGDNFAPGAQVKLSLTGQSDIPATNVTVTTDHRISCRFDLNGRPLGIWDVVVTNNDGQSGTLPASFKIESPNIEATSPLVSEKNPYDPVTGDDYFRYGLSRDADILLYIFNMRGERIWVYRAAAGAEGGRVGANAVRWNGVTSFGTYAPGGAYLVYVSTTVNGGPKVLTMTKLLITK